MRDRLTVMLDSMIVAVDNGHSYDGIVSIPEVGLEDYGRRPGLAGWLDDFVELLRSARVTTAWAIQTRFSKSSPTNLPITTPPSPPAPPNPPAALSTPAAPNTPAPPNAPAPPNHPALPHTPDAPNAPAAPYPSATLNTPASPNTPVPPNIPVSSNAPDPSATPNPPTLPHTPDAPNAPAPPDPRPPAQISVVHGSPRKRPPPSSPEPQDPSSQHVIQATPLQAPQTSSQEGEPVQVQPSPSGTRGITTLATGVLLGQRVDPKPAVPTDTLPRRRDNQFPKNSDAGQQLS